MLRNLALTALTATVAGLPAAWTPGTPCVYTREVSPLRYEEPPDDP